MKRALMVAEELQQIRTIGSLTDVFQATASMHIAQIKSKVLASSSFFNELWHIYTQLRVDPKTRLNNEAARQHRPKQHVCVLITSEGGLSGDIDVRMAAELASNYKPGEVDVIVVGQRGAIQLKRYGFTATKVFALPQVQNGGDITPIADCLSQYQNATVFYQKYISLAHQDIVRIDLFSAVQALSESSHDEGDIISDKGYIFEPSPAEIIGFMEATMVGIALGQVLLESELAQYAARFNAMTQANHKAREMEGDLELAYQRAKRSQNDERTKEILSAMRAV